MRLLMDEREKELIDKAEEYVKTTFSGDYKVAFDDFDRDNDGKINLEELTEFLKHAGIGTRLTRGAWARGVMERVDTNKDGQITWEEFQTALVRK